jgi:hypothetical protein
MTLWIELHMSDGVQLGLPVFGVILSLVVELEEIED